MSTEQNNLPPPKALKVERATVTLEGLQEEFGPAEGRAKYVAIANIEGELTHPETGEAYTHRLFHDPVREKYWPELVVATLPPAARAEVARIISTVQVKE
jgi:hypothetical protein